MLESKKKILVSSISVNNDPYNTEPKGRSPRVSPQEKKELEAKGIVVYDGPHLTLFSQINDFTDFYLLYNEDKKTEAPVNELISEMQIRFPSIQAHKEKLPIKDPTEYEEVYPRFLEFIVGLQNKWTPENGHEYFVLVNPGTPTMQAVWHFLIASELLKATPLKTYRPEHEKQSGFKVKEVSLQVDKMPIIDKLRRDINIQAVKDMQKKEAITRLSRFFASNLYGPEPSYGIYQITHEQAEPKVKDTLARIDKDFQNIEDIVSGEGKNALKQYIENARTKIQEGFSSYQAWEKEKMQSIKELFRCNLKEFFLKLSGEFPNLNIEKNLEREGEIYIEKSLFEKGIRAIIKGADNHAYSPHTKPEERKFRISCSQNGQELRIELEDKGKGCVDIRSMLEKTAGATGNDIASIKELLRYFHIVVESSCHVQSNYDWNTNNENKKYYKEGEGLKYTLTVELPSTLSAVGEDFCD